jgi:hypothetical protein
LSTSHPCSETHHERHHPPEILVIDSAVAQHLMTTAPFFDQNSYKGHHGR